MSSLQTSKDNLTLQMTENTKDLENQLQLAKDDAKIAKKNLEVEQMKQVSQYCFHSKTMKIFFFSPSSKKKK